MSEIIKTKPSSRDYAYTRAQMSEALPYLLNKKRENIPSSIYSTRDIKNFERKFKPITVGSKEKTGDMIKTIDDCEFYHADGRQIVLQEDINKVLTPVYNDPATGFGGIIRFYKRVKGMFAGISRLDVTEFLANQQTNQLYRPTKTSKSHNSFMVYKPLSYFQIDLVDVNKWKGFNQQNKYLITMIDIYSKYAFVSLISNKQPVKIVRFLTEIYDQVKGLGGSFSVLSSDQGSEFKNKLVSDWCADRKIKQIFGSPYKSRSQSHIERFNKTIRLLLGKAIQSSGNKSFATYIDELHANYNTSFHTVIGCSPNDVVEAFADNNIKFLDELEARMRHITDVKRGINDEETEDLEVDDVVRISIHADLTRAKALKDGSQKTDMPNWSIDLYVIDRVIQRTTDTRYKLKRLDEDNKPIETDNEQTKKIYQAKDLQKIDITKTTITRKSKETYESVAEPYHTDSDDEEQLDRPPPLRRSTRDARHTERMEKHLQARK